MEFISALDETCSGVSLACRQGNCTALQSFLNTDGKCVDVQDDRGWRPIHEAVDNKHIDCVKLLLEQPENDINWETFDGDTPLLMALRNGDANMVHILLKHGADPNMTNYKWKESSLHLAATADSLPCVEMLIDAGACVDRHNWTGQFPLHAAVIFSSLSVVQLLVENGAKLDSCDVFRVTPIHLAATAGRGDALCLRFLLRKAEQTGLHWLVNAEDENKRTPLMMAAEMGSLECVQLLLSSGADPNKKNVDNETALHMAIQEGHLNHGILKHLLDAGCNANVCLLDVEKCLNTREDYETFGIVLQLHTGHVCGLKRPVFVSALGLAVHKGSIEDVTALLDAGAHVEPHSQDIIAPLTIAAFEGSSEMVDLLNHGANPNYPGQAAPRVCPCPLIAATNNYRTLRQLLKAGGDARRCFPVGHGNCLPLVQFYLEHYPNPDSPANMPKVLTVYQEFLGNRIATQYLNNIYLRWIDVYDRPEPYVHQWIRIFNMPDKPCSLAHLCRLKIREVIMDNGMNASLSKQICSLQLPNRIIQYLKFD